MLSSAYTGSVVKNGQTVIRPLDSETNPFKKSKGALKTFRSRKEINAWISEMRDDEKHTLDASGYRRDFPSCM
jgi:hypothetical protein